jgi:hypothetical protein
LIILNWLGTATGILNKKKLNISILKMLLCNFLYILFWMKFDGVTASILSLSTMLFYICYMLNLHNRNFNKNLG